MNAPFKRRGALETLDHAIELARAQPLSEIARACVPGALLAWLVLSLYYLERVEGVRALRPVFACALVAGFAARAVVLGRWAGRRAQHELAQSGVHGALASRASMVRAALWVGFELWFWLWPAVVLIRVDPWLLPALLPLWCVRAAIAPSWLAVIDASGETTGIRTFKAAILHCEGQRGQAIVCELFLLLGALAIAFNVGAVVMLAVTLAQTALGLDLSTVRAFVSPQNHFMLLSVVAFALVLLEPVRAALSSLLYVQAELERGGAGVRALVHRAVQPREGGAGARMGLLVCLLLAVPEVAAAEQPDLFPASAVEPAEAETSEAEQLEQACDEPCQRALARDATIEARVEQILAEPEFAEFPDERWDIDGKGALQRWLAELFARWFADLDAPSEKSPSGAFRGAELPGAAFFLTLAVVLLMIALARLSFFGGAHRVTRTGDAAPARDDPFERAADDHFADAQRLFADDPREALRALYLGALVGLARKDLLQLAPERSNGQYLRQLKGRAERALFAELTRTFDAVHYGQRALDRERFQRCLELARALAAPGDAPTMELAG